MTEVDDYEFGGVERKVGRIWDRNAEFWDGRMGDGNRWHRELIAPNQERLLELHEGEVVLDVACGNGNFSRRMSELGVDVVGFDLSEGMIGRARARGSRGPGRIEYRVIDASGRRCDSVTGSSPVRRGSLHDGHDGHAQNLSAAFGPRPGSETRWTVRVLGASPVLQLDFYPVLAGGVGTRRALCNATTRSGSASTLSRHSAWGSQWVANRSLITPSTGRSAPCSVRVSRLGSS